MIQKIGSMVYQLRKKVFVSQENLSRGLLSVAELSRIENGEKEGDSFLMTALFQRLGKSMDQFEMTVSNAEYKLILLRAFIQESMESGDYDRTVELIDEYEESMEKDKMLQVQYVGMIRTALRYLNGEDKAECLEQLRAAMLLTFVDENRIDWTGYCFCIQEVQVLLFIAYLQMELGEHREAISLLQKLHDCIDVTYTSTTSKVQVYPKCCYLLAKAYLNVGKPKAALKVSREGVECLVQKGSMIFLEELLEIQQRCEPKEETRNQLEALQFAHELVGDTRTEVTIVRFLFSGVTQDITLSNELLREIRTAQGRSQEEVCEGICSRETLSRIEKGRPPSRTNLKKLLKKLGIKRQKYHNYIYTDDWETFELVREYKKNCFEENQEDALGLIDTIEHNLDMSVPANKQFVEFARLRYKIRKRQVKWDEAIEKLSDLLRYTMPEYDGELVRIPYREEFLILNRIALCLKLCGRKEEAIKLYEDILKKYQSSEVRPEHHIYVMTLLYTNYSELLEVCGDSAKAEEYAKKGLKLTLKYQRGDRLGVFLANLACVYEKSQTQADKALTLPCLQAGYHILRLFKLENKSKAVLKYMEEYYT